MAGKLTIKQRVLIGKGRILDFIEETTNGAHGYHNLTDDDRKKLRKLFAIMAQPESDKLTLEALDKAGYINGEEETFYNKDA